MPNPRDWTRFHERNILREEVANYSKLVAGNIVRFNYTGKDAHIKRPLVFVLNPNWRGKLHGVSLTYINDDILIKFRDIVHETVQNRLAKLLRLRLPLIKPDLRDPQKFYQSQLKPFIKTYFDKSNSPYRIYIRSNIKNLRVLDYRFKDFYIGSTGEENTVRGQTRER